MYIALEGIDLVGKTTQIELLKAKFQEAIFTREPGGTNFGLSIREILLHKDNKLADMTEFLLFLADRSEHYHQIIKPAQKYNKLLISDRSLFSGIAYGLESGKLSQNFIINTNLEVIENMLPNLVIFFEISKSELLNRLNKRSPDKIEKRGIEYALSIQTRLLNFPKELNVQTLVINATDNEMDIHKQIVNAILNKISGI
jgi:dTMP kinase